MQDSKSIRENYYYFVRINPKFVVNIRKIQNLRMPKIAVISDIHGNLPALEKVLKYLDKEKPDMWLCLGDVVGYGPFPSECIDILRERKIPTVLGNHDAGVAGLLTLKHFRDPNRTLIQKTSNMLSHDQIAWLKSLPLTLKNNTEGWIAVHAHPKNPERWEYVDSAINARTILSEIDQDICFVGHTHIPALVSNQIGVNTFKSGFKYLINPGSVGQSRDGDFRASCCLVDTENYSFNIKRTEYNAELVLTELNHLGFSREEAHRLLRY